VLHGQLQHHAVVQLHTFNGAVLLQDRLLQHDAALTPLYERLSVPSWTAAQLLAQGLLPAWSQLPQQVGLLLGALGNSHTPSPLSM
jgi:hypothetical protein